jgi:RNA polymerase sigma factor (sigma-70 family)
VSQGHVKPLIYVVDDDPAMRDSLRWLLESAGYRVALYESADQFLMAQNIEAGACVLLDVRMPGMSGLSAQEALIERGTGLPIIFITGHGDVPMAVNAIKRGAVDFIEKPFNDDALLSLIDAALKSNRRLRAAQASRRLVASRIDALSPREREVMEFVIAGKPNKIIADELGISIKTVEVHRARVMQKLGVSSVAELAQAMIEPTAANLPPMPRP